ncbi:PhoH family protein [Candidatus Woesearchaeota archaeon]|nr:PhoH family protein [Candidatus Woesearchaeota archaeon]
MTPQGAKHIHVVDTSSLLDNPKCLRKLGEGGNIVVIPAGVLTELDVHAKREGVVRLAAREVVREIDRLRKSCLIHSNPEAAVGGRLSYDNGGKVAWYLPPVKQVRAYQERHFRSGPITIDELILVTATHCMEKFPEYRTGVITEDINLRCRAHMEQVPAESLRIGKTELDNPDELYNGFCEFFVAEESLRKFMQSGVGLEKYLDLDDVRGGAKDAPRLVWNQGVKLTHSRHNKMYVLTRFNAEKQRLECLQHAVAFDEGKPLEVFQQCFPVKTVFGMTPGDPRQILYMDYLLDPSIEIVAVNGKYGTGKTKLMMAAALHQLLGSAGGDVDKRLSEHCQFADGIRVLRPEYIANQRDIGYLPGNIDEKMQPFVAPIYNAIDKLAQLNKDRRLRKLLEDKGMLSILATTFLRGLDISDTIVCMDETQNGDASLAILFTSRLGSDTKTYIGGDITQIDNPYVDHRNNMLTLCTEAIRLRPTPERAAITLTENYRKGGSRLTEDILAVAKRADGL